MSQRKYKTIMGGTDWTFPLFGEREETFVRPYAASDGQ